MAYRQLTREQKYQIYPLMKAGLSQAAITRIIGVHKSTTSREMRRNRELRGYRPQQALGSLAERKSRFTLLSEVRHIRADLVSRAIRRLLEPIASKVFTLTSGNSKEFAKSIRK